MEDRLYASYEKADEVVESLQQRGINIQWDGWEIVIHQPNPVAFYYKTGKFCNGQWGFERRIKPRGLDGRWAIPINYGHSERIRSR